MVNKSMPPESYRMAGVGRLRWRRIGRINGRWQSRQHLFTDHVPEVGSGPIVGFSVCCISTNGDHVGQRRVVLSDRLPVVSPTFPCQRCLEGMGDRES